jgi:hypothetical protein
MKYEDWLKNSKEVIEAGAEINMWRMSAKYHLLSVIGPRIAKLSRKFYAGCGYHYSLEQALGRLLVSLSIPWRPSASHCESVEDNRAKWVGLQVSYEMLIANVEEAEQSISRWRKLREYVKKIISR